jgi:hypothetical protein
MRIKIFESTHRTQGNADFNIKAENAQTTPEFRELYDKAGVYRLYAGKDARAPIYIGRSKSNLAKTISRHFQNWSAKEIKYVERDPKKLDRMFVEVEIMPAASESETDAIIDRETELIEQYKPRLNIRKKQEAQKDADYYTRLEQRKEYQAEQQARAEEEAAAAADLLAAEIAEQEARQAQEQADQQAAEAQAAAEQAEREQLQAMEAAERARIEEQQAEQAQANARNAQAAAEKAEAQRVKRLQQHGHNYKGVFKF